MANWYVRKGGADTNGGSSSGTSPDRSGADMGTTNNNTQVTSASASFGAGDVGKGIMIATVLYRIATFTNATTIQLDRVYGGTTGTNRAWAIGGAFLTIGKLLATAAAIIQNGDTVWIGSGVYRESVTIAMTALTANATIQGDVDGVQTGDVGEVRWTAWTTNDKTAPGAGAPVILNGKPYLTFQYITFHGSSTAAVDCVDGRTTGSTHISLVGCTFLPGTAISPNHVACTMAVDTAANWTIDSCIFGPGSVPIIVSAPRPSAADLDLNFVVKNCLSLCSGPVINITVTGANSFKWGGIKLWNSSFFGGGNAITTGANISTTDPITVYGCTFYGSGSTLFNASGVGQIVEDYNVFTGYSVNYGGSTAVGAHSKASSYAQGLIEIGQSIWVGRTLRPYGMPTFDSPLLGFGAQAGSPSVDLIGFTRPAGGGSPSNSVGPFERGNSGVRNNSTYDTATPSMSFIGPGYQDMPLVVRSGSHTITVQVRWDSTYAGTLPQVSVVNGTECGVANASTTATGSANAWNATTLSISPTANGIVTIRLISSDTNGGGGSFFDDLTVS